MTTQERTKQYVEQERRKRIRDEVAVYNQLIAECRNSVVPSSKRTLTVADAPERYKNQRFVWVINTMLSNIRAGGIEYVTTLQRLKCLLSFEPEALVWYVPRAKLIAIALPETPENLERFVEPKDEEDTGV